MIKKAVFRNPFKREFFPLVEESLNLDSREFSSELFERIPELQPFTGRDKRVRNYVLEQKECHDFLHYFNDFLNFLIPRYLPFKRGFIFYFLSLIILSDNIGLTFYPVESIEKFCS